jgi:hypothetical protein
MTQGESLLIAIVVNDEAASPIIMGERIHTESDLTSSSTPRYNKRIG